MRLEGQKALVTGGSMGIGRAIALRFAEEGADVAVTSRHPDDLEPVVRRIEEFGRVGVAASWDVTCVEEIPARLEEVAQALGGLDVVVNNAGVVRLPGDSEIHSPEFEWDYILDINLKGAYFLCRGAAERMRETGGGVIINLVSDSAYRGAPNPYGISKWGVRGMTRGLGRQLAADGIRLNGIAPGPVATRMMGCPDEEVKECKQAPLGRFSTPEEVAAVAVFLASEDARAVAGHTIEVNTVNG